uniref:PAS domain-containing sensor histidine kinase n=1 Tax=Ferroglobus sp. TaxID=2614230 RepID=UPI0025BBF7BB
DGKIKWILESVVSIRYKGKRAVLGNFVDITERKELEEMNEKLLEYTTHLNRMLRHDLKNVLSAISLSSELLRDSGVENRAVDLIERSIERGFEIIESAKETEEIIRTGKLKEINLKDVLARIEECFKDVEVKAEDVIILADDTIFNVLSNLIENAFKHGGAKKVRISVRKEDDFAVITVEDDGKGIPKEIREKIFDYGFSYGKKAGSGVGLYVVRRAVERWGGKISVGESELGGAKFIIKLGCVECLRKKPF